MAAYACDHQYRRWPEGMMQNKREPYRVEQVPMFQNPRPR